MPESKGRRRSRRRPLQARRGGGASTPAGGIRDETQTAGSRWRPRIRRRTWRRVRRWSFLGVAGAAALALIIAFVVQSFPAGLGGIETVAGDGAQIGDHWHAGLVLEICAEKITLPPSGSGVHSHGDGLIHVHPHKESETGAGANLGRFFDSFDGPPMLMESDRIRVPDGELYENGQPCPDGEPGNVQVLANGEDITQTFKSYTPREGDSVEVYFR